MFVSATPLRNKNQTYYQNVRLIKIELLREGESQRNNSDNLSSRCVGTLTRKDKKIGDRLGRRIIESKFNETLLPPP